MAPRPAHAAAIARPADEYRPPHDARAPDFQAETPTFAPSGPARNASVQFHTYIRFLPRPEASPPSASSLPDPAAEYSIHPSSSEQQARRARLPPACRHSPKLKLSRSVFRSTKYRRQNVHSEDRQTMAASSSSRRHTPPPSPTAASAGR